MATEDEATKQGLVHLYDLEYDKAIADFELAGKAHPEDPFAANHVLQATLLKELYRLNALDTTLYADNGFLTGKPLVGDPTVKARINELAEEAIGLADRQLKARPDDVNMLYARGVSKSLRLSYAAIVEKSFFASLRNATSSRADHERVLQLDPNYTDAKLIIGAHNFVIGSLSLAGRMMAGIVGLTGNKQKGLDYLYEVARSNGEASVDARVALALFLRREAKYAEALEVAQTLGKQYPKNFLFGLEEANLLKDSGRGPEAIATYSELLKNGKAGIYAQPHLERAAFGLAETLKGQRRAQEALDAYQMALAFPDLQADIRIRALLGAGQMLDVLSHRAEAEKNYRETISLDEDSPQAASARKYLKQGFRY